MKVSDKKSYDFLAENKIKIAKYKYIRASLRKTNELEEAAQKLGYPIVIKADSPEIIHKKSQGCVKIVDNSSQLKQKFKSLIKNARKITRNIDGIFVQEYIIGDELILGGIRDKQLGPSVLLGIGGSLVEKINKVSFRLAPLDKDDAESMIKELDLEDFLKQRKSYRPVRKALRKVSKIMEERDKIMEMDINPFFVPDCKAGDVRIIVKNKFW